MASAMVIFLYLKGIEPTHPAPEAGALSTELQAQTLCQLLYNIWKQNSRKISEKLVEAKLRRRKNGFFGAVNNTKLF